MPRTELWPMPDRDTRRQRIEKESVRIWKSGITPRKAAARLQRHVDVPVVLPALRGRWTVVPERIEWGRYRGRRVGSLELRHRAQYLLISYDAGGFFDGCGGDQAIPTRVASRRAMIYVSPSAHPFYGHVV